MMRPFYLVLGVAVLSLVGLCLHGVAANNDKPAKPIDKYLYPHSEDASPGVLAGKIYSVRMTTPHDFEKVIAFYEKQTGASLAVKEAGAVTGSADGVSVIDDSRDRPLTMRVLVKDIGSGWLTVIISRAKDDKVTHLVLTHVMR
jgi:hypothetical protein